MTRMNRWQWLVLALTGCASPGWNHSPSPKPGAQTPQHGEWRVAATARADYLIYLPPDYVAGGAKRWPMILFLHGAGERGTDLNKVAVHGPPKIIKSRPDFPFIIVSPQCPVGETWSRLVLTHLLDEVSTRHAVDTNRIYLTGLSMGGYGTWMLGLAHPERFAAIAPICGGGEIISILLAEGKKLDSLRSLGIWAFHGAKDELVPMEESDRMIKALRRKGCKDVDLTIYPEAGHDSWTKTYDNPALYEWFLKHDRSKSP